MDIIVFGPDAHKNSEKAQRLIAQHMGHARFEYCMQYVFMVNPTLENLATVPGFEAVLADELTDAGHLNNAIAAVQRYRAEADKPHLLAVYCTTENPVCLFNAAHGSKVEPTVNEIDTYDPDTFLSLRVSMTDGTIFEAKEVLPSGFIDAVIYRNSDYLKHGKFEQRAFNPKTVRAANKFEEDEYLRLLRETQYRIV